MRDVLIRVIVISAMLLVGVLSAPAQGAGDGDGLFGKLDSAELLRSIDAYGMVELIKHVPTDKTPAGTLITVRMQAKSMWGIADPAQRLAMGKKLIATLEGVIDQAEEDMETAEKAAEKIPAGKAKRDKALAAAKAAHTYYDILYLLGDMAGRQAVSGYSTRMMYMQDNRQDRKTILEMTQVASLDLEDMQAELQAALRDWQRDMAVWMIMGAKGERLIRDARYWSTKTYLNRALAMGDAEAHAAERAELQGACRTAVARTADADKKKALKDKLDADLAKLTAVQKTRTAQRKTLLAKVLAILPMFEKTRRYGVTHDARHVMAVANRELGRYDEAVNLLAPQRYQNADAGMKLRIAMELPLTLVKQGKFAEAAKAIDSFKRFAEMTAGRGQALDEIQQAQVDLKVAILKEYLARRWAASSTTPEERAKHEAEASTALVEFIEKHKDPGIRQSFIDFFGNRLLYTQDVETLNSMQLYIVASGASARKEPRKRMDMLETFLSRKDDPIVKKLAPEAHWQLALALNELGRQMNAADHFVSVLTLLGPDHPRSPRAAQNASICMEQYVNWYEKNQKQPLPRSVRLKYAAALQHAVSFDNNKNADLKLFAWYYPLGRNCDRLAQTSTTTEEKVTWMRKAADAFSKVPQDPPGIYFNAQDMWLDLRYRALNSAPQDAKATAEAVQLRTDYAGLIRKIEKFIAAMPDKTTEQAEGLTESAAWAAFTRAKLLSDQLKKKTQAQVEIAALLKKWSAVKSVVMAASQWKIQALVDQDKIAEASEELLAFMKKNPDAVAGLIDQVIEGIRKKIGALQAKGGQKAQLASYRKSYLQLAAKLYEDIKGKPIEVDGKVDNERLNLTQLWIDALVQNDKGPEAMKLAAECRRIFNERRDAEARKIDEMFAGKIARCKAAIGLPAALRKLVAEFIADLKLHKVEVEENSRPVLIAQKAMEEGIRNKDPKEKLMRFMGSLSLEIETGYREIMRVMKGRIPIDLSIEWNYAKCLAATGKYNDSLLIYVRLIKGTDPRGDKMMQRRFWRLQLEYCRTFIKALNKDKERMGKLVDYIEKDLPKIGGNELGGFKAEFFFLKEQARRYRKAAE